MVINTISIYLKNWKWLPEVLSMYLKNCYMIKIILFFLLPILSPTGLYYKFHLFCFQMLKSTKTKTTGQFMEHLNNKTNTIPDKLPCLLTNWCVLQSRKPRNVLSSTVPVRIIGQLFLFLIPIQMVFSKHHL